ncbi:MAG: PQQ-dependent dehydrogenase, methanol/ethanol family [Pseudomonadota bacterium]|nr:PQQ-dependent dehydrogenase, methanol/ethanol family [Pseudomonadota bacterium]
MRIHKPLLGIALLLSIGLAACQKKAATADPLANPAAITQERLLKGTTDGDAWPTYGGSYSEQRFSPLKAINTENVGQLGLQWFADYDTNLDQHGTPLYVDGVIYVSTAFNTKVYAFDAKTGKELWKYSTKTDGGWLRNVCCGNINRGIAAFNGKIFVGTLDARVIAIDAKTGEAAWITDTIIGDRNDPLNRLSITMAPRVAKGKVFVGASGGEFGVRGWIAAFDVDTGKEVWRFYNVPGDPAKGFENAAMEAAAKTWSGEWWKLGGGGSVWDATIYDPVTDLLYYGTGNGTPWLASARDPKLGDNLYIASIIALKPDTGEYVWHYQATPGDNWDYDATSPMMTADITIDGQQRHVLMQPNKNGFLYVLDAASGKLLSADKFTEVNWATHVDLETGRPAVVAEARYEKRPWNLAPGVQGGHSWHPNAYSPETGLMYIPAWEAYFIMQKDPNYAPSTGGFNLGISFGGPQGISLPNVAPTDKEGIYGRLIAWDPVARKIVWETPPFDNDRPSGGVMATAGGLVFAGNGAGQELRAYDAKTGDQLWSFPAHTSVFAAPITYELDGEQYVAASVGGSAAGEGYFAPGYARMLVFKLGATAALPPKLPYTPPPLNPPPSTASAAVIERGRVVYEQYCTVCHGVDGVQPRGTFPNLTTTPMLHSQQAFDQIIHGARADKGMGDFSKDVGPEDSAALREYLIARANVVKERQPPPAPVDNSGNQHQQ